jgi:hypothetical protein
VDDSMTTIIRGMAIAGFAVCLSACHVQWVSPYSADLQKRSSDMLSDVAAWESHMRSVAGTAAADPRNPEVQAKLAAWHGDIEAMSEIELSIDPGATRCDQFIAAIGGKISGTLKAALPDGTTAAGSGAPPGHCETLPNIFTSMNKQVSAGQGDQAGVILVVLEQQCKLPWLSDEYFDNLNEARATAGASSPARPATAAAKPGTPTAAQQADAVSHCRTLFVPVAGEPHGNLVDSLITDLAAIIYREGREAPPSSK